MLGQNQLHIPFRLPLSFLSFHPVTKAASLFVQSSSPSSDLIFCGKVPTREFGKICLHRYRGYGGHMGTTCGQRRSLDQHQLETRKQPLNGYKRKGRQRPQIHHPRLNAHRNLQQFVKQPARTLPILPHPSTPYRDIRVSVPEIYCFSSLGSNRALPSDHHSCWIKLAFILLHFIYKVQRRNNQDGQYGKLHFSSELRYEISYMKKNIFATCLVKIVGECRQGRTPF